IFFLLAVLGIGFVCYRVLSPFLAAIAWAIVLAVAFQKPWLFLERRMPRHRSLAAAMLTIAVAVGVLVPVGLLVRVLTNQVIAAATKITASLSAGEVRSFSDFVALPKVARVLDDARTWAGISPKAFEKLTNAVGTRISTAAGALSGRLALGMFDAMLTVVLVIFLLFFIFRDGERMAAATLDLMPTDADGRSRMSRSLQSMLAAIFRGSLLCALVQGLLGAIGWWIARLPSPVLAGVVMAIVSLLPLGGTALVWLPGAVWAWSLGHHASAIFLLLWGFFVTVLLVDAFLRPMLVRGADELTTLIVFLGVFGGLATFGLLGIFIGPVALAIAVTLLEVMRGQAGSPRPDTAG
ncbi:MAG TPA: AI-2E family transporter, partial [Thermoanaerobaculaceae bacterium]|nr:AI-2E family transporter [Thermoanaerobaculaceae bacterium]